MPRKTILPKQIIRRAYSIFFIFIIGYLVLVYRIIDIQFIDSDLYQEKIENQNTRKIELNSGRGTIYDRNKKPLTDTKISKIIVVPKKQILNDNETKDLVNKIIKDESGDLKTDIEYKVLESVVEIETKSIDYNLEKQLEEKGVIVENKKLRYSSDGLLSHTIGYISGVDKIGQYGIEKSMEELLNNSHEEYVSVFKAGQAGNEGNKNVGILKGTIKTVDKNDDDKHIKLTIDKDIQSIVEDTVDKEDNPSAVVISDVNTGEILAISSRPTFDQYDLSKYINSRDGETMNRAIQVNYPIGSIFKIVVLYAALENNIIDENYTYECSGNITIGNNNEILNCNKLDGHGPQTLKDAFSNSCNPAFLDIAMKVGKEKIIEAARKLHMEEKVDIGLEEENFDLIPQNISIRNLAIGQGSMEFTPIQVNQMTQIIANNGTYKSLYLYDSILDSNKNIIKTFKNTKSEDIISPYSISKVKELMKNVSKEGTGKELNDLPGGCGVKTGTAQSTVNNIKVNHSWITGFYPENKPKYAITVLVEGNENGNKQALPIFKEICMKINNKIK
nr:penicillin-binding protein 2 [uncultured Romboutsia sp.]